MSDNGTFDRIAGKAKEAAGKVTGNKDTETEASSSRPRARSRRSPRTPRTPSRVRSTTSRATSKRRRDIRRAPSLLKEAGRYCVAETGVSRSQGSGSEPR